MGHVLVVEDYPEVSTMYRTALENRGHSVVTATEGVQCLKIYREAMNVFDKDVLEHEPFDIVILDLRMSGICGFFHVMHNSFRVSYDLIEPFRW
jgi:CheY-like chemotaxis protein